MMTKSPSTAKERRVNVYLESDETELIDAIARRLHEQGEKGIYDRNDKPNKSLVVRLALRKWLETLP